MDWYWRHKIMQSSSIDTQALIESAKAAALEAGRFIRAASDDIPGLTIEQKSRHDFVSEVDRESERLIRNMIQAKHSSHAIVGEELGTHEASEEAPIWYIDPLDGTTNFLRSIAHYAVSIAVYQNQSPLAAVVYDPAKDELFWAQKGQGAWLNESPITVSTSDSLYGALLATGVPYSGHFLKSLPSFLDTVNGLLAHQTSGIRRLGSAALDLAYVAAGRYDGYWEAGLRPWDIAAGMLLVEEAGGVCSDFGQGAQSLVSGDVVAANATVHAQMVSITGLHYPYD